MGGSTVGNALSSRRGYLSERANDLTRAMGKDKKDVGSKQVRIRDLNIPARELAQFSVNLDRRPNVGFPVAFYGADADPSLLHSQVTEDFAIAPEKITPTLEEAILKEALAPELLAAARVDGFQTMQEIARGFIKDGVFSVAEYTRILVL